MKLEKEQVRQLALECGFHLKVQDDGSKDLNPYVYRFADKICEHTVQAGVDAHRALLVMISEDLHKVLEKLNAHETKDAIKDLKGVCGKLCRCEKALQNKPVKTRVSRHNLAEVEELKDLLMETGLLEDVSWALILLSLVACR